MTNFVPRRSAVAAAVSVGLIALASACGDDSAAVSLSEAGERGREISSSKGCAACHGSNGQGGAGPAWVGLAGAEVELQDGTVVVADNSYLVRAIADPSADVRVGFTLRMPSNGLSESEIADVIAYIEDLSVEPGGG